uniref:Uncharacterized protein n=1 Tax=Oncorhynchus kisutch TaxID=8019 RepID=A0A8C7D8P2_ONCKI
MSGYGGLRSCTWTEFSTQVFTNSSLIPQGSATGSHCDLTLLTCLLIGSYRFCIIPLLAAFNGKTRIRFIFLFSVCFLLVFFTLNLPNSSQISC